MKKAEISRVIKIASSLPVGDKYRRELLASLVKKAKLTRMSGVITNPDDMAKELFVGYFHSTGESEIDIDYESIPNKVKNKLKAASAAVISFGFKLDWKQLDLLAELSLTRDYNSIQDLNEIIDEASGQLTKHNFGLLSNPESLPVIKKFSKANTDLGLFLV